MGLDFLADHAGALADKPAVICGDRVLDFATLSSQASRVALGKRSRGSVPNAASASASARAPSTASSATTMRNSGTAVDSREAHSRVFAL